MNPEPVDVLCLAAWLIIPIIFIIFWVRMRLGLDKRWFVVPAAPFVSRSFYFALPTFVLGFVIVIISGLLYILNPHINGMPLLYIAWGLWGISFIFAYFEPKWMSPRWYNELKEKHGDILPYLAHEAHKLGRKRWLQISATPESLEKWIAEFRAKHGL